MDINTILVIVQLITVIATLISAFLLYQNHINKRAARLYFKELLPDVKELFEGCKK